MSWFNLRPYPGICHEDEGRPRENRLGSSEGLSRDANLAFPQCKSEALPFELFARPFRPKFFLTSGYYCGENDC